MRPRRSVEGPSVALACAGLCLALAWVLLAVTQVVAAESPSAVPTGEPWQTATGHIVQPGDTLAEIAGQWGVTAATLARINGLQSPRLIYPGQHLKLPAGARHLSTVHVMAAGDDLLTLSRAGGVSVATVARANQLLKLDTVPVGWRVRLPQPSSFRVVPAFDDASLASAPRIAAAAVSKSRLWDVLWLNPIPHTAGQELLVPEEDGGLWRAHGRIGRDLPHPMIGLSMSPQPMARGETVVVMVAVSEPVSCRLTAFDNVESCVALDGQGTYVALAGLSPMMMPGAYDLQLSVTTADGSGIEVPVPIQVTEGRFDYERIDLPPDRQALLDPSLSQQERDTIARLRTVRSPERLWEYPFQRPVDSAITSYFGSRRSYGYGFGSYHAGSDFDGVGGEPVLAPASGTVLLAESLIVRGQAILVDHGWGVVSGFWHLSEIDVAVGDRVTQAQRLGALGNTGLSTGAHLHWELWVNGAAVNALSWLEPDGPAALLGASP